MADLLFIPAPEFRDALLGDGVGGARMPWAYEHGGGGDPYWTLHPPWCDVVTEAGIARRLSTALILIWHDEVAQEGCDRLARVLNASDARWSFDLRCDYSGSVDGAHGLAALAERAGLGRVVRIDQRASAPTEK